MSSDDTHDHPADDPDLTPVWKALADPTRRTILDRLAQRPHTTGELAALFALSRFAVMKHLDVLERAGLVVVRRQGRERWNALNGVPLQRIYERWISPTAGRWASSLLALKRVSEGVEKRAMPETATAAPVTTLHIEQEVRIEAPRERVWNALTADVAAWWGAPYLIGAQAERIVLEPHVGGRLYELWAEGEEQGGLWGIVTQLLANRLLEITGTIGMRGAVHGVVQYELEPAGDDRQATLLKLSHRAFGEIASQAEAGYTSGWQELLATRLKAFVERGERLGLDRGPA